MVIQYNFQFAMRPYSIDKKCGRRNYYLHHLMLIGQAGPVVSIRQTGPVVYLHAVPPVRRFSLAVCATTDQNPRVRMCRNVKGNATHWIFEPETDLDNSGHQSLLSLANAAKRGKNLMPLSLSSLILALSGIEFSRMIGTALGHALPWCG
jgi:hypothetical protein